MDTDGYEHAVVSDAAYNFYEKGDEYAQHELDDYLEGYTIDPEYSDDHAVTILRPDGSAIIGYRGTDPYNIFDIGADTLILFGSHRQKSSIIPYTRFQRSNDFYRTVSQNYDVKSVTGHSLGGSIADYVARHNNLPAYIFNPGETLSILPGESPALYEDSFESKTKVYTTGKDPISIGVYMTKDHQEIVEVPKTVETGSFLDSHSRHNFLPKRRKKVEQLPVATQMTNERPVVQQRKKLCRMYPQLCPKGD
jgi:hypothetical protein